MDNSTKWVGIFGSTDGNLPKRFEVRRLEVGVTVMWAEMGGKIWEINGWMWASIVKLTETETDERKRHRLDVIILLGLSNL